MSGPQVGVGGPTPAEKRCGAFTIFCAKQHAHPSGADRSSPRPGRIGMGASRERISPQSGAAATQISPHSAPGNREIGEKQEQNSSRSENLPAGPSHCRHLPRRIPPSCWTALPPAWLAPSTKPLKLFDQLCCFF